MEAKTQYTRETKATPAMAHVRAVLFSVIMSKPEARWILEALSRRSIRCGGEVRQENRIEPRGTFMKEGFAVRPCDAAR
jgi:hypothetical protein